MMPCPQSQGTARFQDVVVGPLLALCFRPVASLGVIDVLCMRESVAVDKVSFVMDWRTWQTQETAIPHLVVGPDSNINGLGQLSVIGQVDKGHGMAQLRGPKVGCPGLAVGYWVDERDNCAATQLG